MFTRDDASKYHIRSDDQQLTFDNRDAAVCRQSFWVHLVVDDTPVAWVDENLRRGGVERRRQKAVRKRKDYRNRGGPKDRRAPPLDDLNEFPEIDSGIIGLSPSRRGRVLDHLADCPGRLLVQHWFHRM